MSDEALRYPIGKFVSKDQYSASEIAQNIQAIELLPSKVETISKTLSAKQWDTPYRDGGWTARQVVHHIADSHMNAYIRWKWALTENTPTIKAYDEKLWAETPEVNLDPTISIQLLKGLHQKWVSLMKSLKPEQLERDFLHPESGKKFKLERLTGLYAWHGEHHLGHLKIIASK